MKNKKKQVVLNVEDSPDIRVLVKRFLESDGYDVASAENGVIGLDVVKKVNPDLILLDVMMPEMNGYEFCTRLQAHKDLRNIPIVYLTVRSDPKDKAKALSLGAVDYLTKPFSKKDLTDIVAKHIQTKQRWQQMHAEAVSGTDEAGKEFLDFKNELLDHYSLPTEDREKLLLASPQQLYAVCGKVGIESNDLAKKISQTLGRPYMTSIDPSRLILGILPTSFCKENNVIAIRGKTKSWAFVVSNPFDQVMLNLLRKFIASERLPRLYVAAPETLQKILNPLPNKSNSQTKKRSLSVLLVEDDKAQQVLIKRFLENRGHQVALAPDGIEAFMNLGRSTFDLILLDLSLPHLSGLNFLRVKEEKKIDVPVMVLTVHTESDYETLSRQLGAIDYIQKPIQKGSFVEKIESYCRI